ncbi:hypothetical protein [Methylocystis parvus]|uniref:Uncharacterized protein n=1 Tax=Methylocystis parvus TaxID=134 RepID=A0A6B8M350_9HYPH|nr:hypothetical protein [Methylocystis parvus]QGM99347.1 hypothetical protein F7D14_18910 [Methylocystis parvus]WBK00263.1 hypothetical protein MMG94_00625 [Methylocystis parvus OBBP]
MADYYSLISRAIAALPQQTPESRQVVYERARKALFSQLRGIQPPVAEADIAAEGRALEEAITRVEIELAAKNSSGPRAGSAKAESSASAAVKPPAPPELPPGERSAEDAWRETLAETESDAPAREPQRPAAPLPMPPKSRRPPTRIIALGAVLVALIAVVGALAWYLRERPEDLAKLKPEESGPAESADAGKFGDRVEGGSAASAPVSGKRATSVPVAQKAEMWVASLQEPDKVDRIYNGTVVWRLENVGGPGQPVGSAIRGDIDIPDGKMKMTLLFQKNNDATLSASHTINVSFKPQSGGPLGGVKAIGPIQMRRADAQSGEKVAGIPVPITDNNFLIGLMRGDREARNIQLLRSLAVIDLPLQLSDGRSATINMEKGPAGERVFSDAIDNWGK